MPELGHPSQYIALANFGPVHIDDRVVARRRLWQTGEHRDLRHAQLIELFAEIDLGRRTEAVSALAEVNLIDVELQDLVLCQAVLDLERQQRLAEFATEGFFSAQEEIACHLHGVRAVTL